MGKISGKKLVIGAILSVSWLLLRETVFSDFL